MLTRQVVPLLLLYTEKGKHISGRTRFQKIIFLAQHEKNDVSNWYNFYPHDFGPYSSDLQNDLDFLALEGLLKEKQQNYEDKIVYQYKLTKKGEQFLLKALDSPKHSESFRNTLNALAKIKNEYQNSPLDKLINDVYRKFPEYAIFSKLIN